MTDLESEQIIKRENPFKDLPGGEILSFLDEIDFFNEWSPCVLKRVSTENIIDYVYDDHTQSAYDLQKILKEKEIAVIRAEEREKFYEVERQKFYDEYLEKVKILEEKQMLLGHYAKYS